jgi:hypothetical protein
MRAAILLFLLALLGLAVALGGACQTYVSPPVASIEGLDNGVLSDPSAPLVIQFSKAIDPSTLKLEVILFDPNSLGQLPDETGAMGDAGALLTYYAHDPTTGDTGGKGTLDSTHTVFTIVPTARFPVGPKLAVLVEPGLWDAAHDPTAETGIRTRLLFSYTFACSGTGTTLLSSGVYFFLLDVEEPVGTQIKIFADLDIAASGRFVGQFTLASRITNPNRCSPSCTDGNVCETIPSPSMCVVPSTRAGGPGEWPDFYANATPPVGFSFTVDGCAEDQSGGTAALATEPANMVVQQPDVQVDGLVVTVSFSVSGGVLTATGTVTGDNIVFGSAQLGAGHGDVEAQFIPASMAPSVPSPPPEGDM